MNKFLKVLSYVLVAAVACTATLLISGNWQQINPESKLTQLADLIDKYYADDVDMGALEDAAANAMVEALPDRWSYYISADEYASYLENKNNVYVGIGVTIQAEEEGYLITKLSSGGPAEEAGLQPGDRMVMADGHSLVGVPVEECRGYIQGKEGTTVAITVLREGEQLTFTVERRTVRTPVATGTMLDHQIGLVKIANFNSHCADETIAAVEALLEQGAKALIFDVRFNGGGYTKEMVTLLDYLLPAVPVFRTVDYKGKESVDYSDADCVDVPMAVLVNGSTYSAAELFAAALAEYDVAVLVGEQTTGKGYYQVTYQLQDGSAVAISTGKYFTPKGVSLEGVGLTPGLYVAVDDQTAAGIYYGTLEPADDPQIQTAVDALLNGA